MEHFIAQYQNNSDEPTYLWSIGDLSTKKDQSKHSDVEYFKLMYVYKTNEIFENNQYGYQLVSINEIIPSYKEIIKDTRIKCLCYRSFEQSCFSELTGIFFNDIIIFHNIATKIRQTKGKKNGKH